MNDWRETTLGQFVSLQRGHDLPSEQRRVGSVPVMGSFGITGWHDEARAPGPGVTVGRSGASIGVVSYIDRDYWPLNTCLFATDFHGNNPRFVYYFLQTLDLAAHNSGSAQPSLNRNYISPIKIFVPGPDTQNNIVNLIGSLDDKIKLNRRTNETLEAMAQAIFRDWFVDFGPTRRKLEGATDPVEIIGGLLQDDVQAQVLADLFPAKLGEDGLPEGWTERKISDVAARIAMGPFGSRITKDNFVAHGVPVIRGKNLSAGFVDSDFVFLTPEKAKELSGSIARAQDIVFTHRGTLGQVGRIYPSATFPEYVVSQSQVLLSADPGKTSSLFLYYFFLSDAGQRAWLANAGGAGVPAIASPTRSLKSIDFIDPGMKIASEFGAIVGTFENRMVSAKNESKTLESTRNLLLPKLMSGEIRLTEAEELMEAAQ